MLGLGSTDPRQMDDDDAAKLMDYARKERPEVLRQTVEEKPWFVKAMGNPIIMGALQWPQRSCSVIGGVEPRSAGMAENSATATDRRIDDILPLRVRRSDASARHESTGSTPCSRASAATIVLQTPVALDTATRRRDPHKRRRCGSWPNRRCPSSQRGRGFRGATTVLGQNQHLKLRLIYAGDSYRRDRAPG